MKPYLQMQWTKTYYDVSKSCRHNKEIKEVILIYNKIIKQIEKLTMPSCFMEEKLHVGWVLLI